MTKIENDCYDCATGAYPCLGNSCPLVNTPHHYCDECGDETQLYDYEGKELCAECILNKYEALYK